MKRNFINKQNHVLSEIYRRLHYFQKGDLNANLLLLDYPSVVKCITQIGLVTVSNGKETPRILNWYKLTDKGKDFFKDYSRKIPLTEDENHRLYIGDIIIDFNTFEKTTE